MQIKPLMRNVRHSRPVLLAMAIVMVEMIAFGFEDMVVLMLDLPASSSSLHN